MDGQRVLHNILGDKCSCDYCMHKDKYGKNRNTDFPIKHLLASRGELEAISKGRSPEVYTHVYGTYDIPKKHQIEAKQVLKDRYGR